MTGCCALRRQAALEKAEAEKVQVVKAAEADSEAKYLQGQVRAAQPSAMPPPAAGCASWSPALWCCRAVRRGRCAAQGIARQRQAIVNGLRESVLNFEREPALPVAALVVPSCHVLCVSSLAAEACLHAVPSRHPLLQVM